MKSLLVGDPAVFAIESHIEEAYERLSLRALGFFILHVAGKSFGVREPDASALACSYDAVARRLADRGKHTAFFAKHTSAVELIVSTCSAGYSLEGENERFFGLSPDAFCEELRANGIWWAPDGDACFDDGANVLQFDNGDQVRLVAGINADQSDDIAGSCAEVWLGADAFYDILDRWLRSFNAEWAALPKI